MKLLIITYDYPPVVTPRALRWETISKYWAQNGHEIDIICGWRPRAIRLEILNNIRISRVGGNISELIRDRILSSKTPIQSSKQDRNGELSYLSKNNAILKRLHDLTWKKIYWPDHACLWFFSALNAAKQMLALYRYDLLLTVSLPFTSHLIGLNLKNIFPEVPWAIDVGDPFFFQTESPSNNHWLYAKLNYNLEKRVIRKSGVIFVTTEGTRQEYIRQFPGSLGKVVVIPPLISYPKTPPISKSALFSSKDKIRFVFIGTLYRDIRNPCFLLQLFTAFGQIYGLDRVELHFFGNVSDCRHYFKPYTELIGESIFLHGLIGHGEAFQAIREADILVNIGNLTSFQLPSKVVEYVSTGKPILNISKVADDSSAQFLRNYRPSICLHESSEISSKQIDDLAAFVESSSTLVGPELEKWKRKYEVESISTSYLYHIGKFIESNNGVSPKS